MIIFRSLRVAPTAPAPIILALVTLGFTFQPVRAQLGPAPIGSQAVTPAGATAPRTLTQKLSDQLSLLDFGAVCDGHTDDSAAIQTAGASGRRIQIPAGLICNGASVAQSLPFGLFVGPGQVLDTSGNHRGPQSSGVTTAPNPTAWNSTTNTNANCVAGFPCWANYDYSHALSAEEFVIGDSNGGHTLGQPLHGYEYMPGAYPHAVFFTNGSGWNNSLTGNDGRTAAVYQRDVAQQNGAGDMILNEAEILCSGHAQTGTTDWLAVPGCSWEAGDITALTASQYLQHSEWHFADNGNDVAAIGRVMGYNRTAATANLNNHWVNDLVSCTGTVACDAAYEVTGKWRIGLDFTEIGTAVTAPLAMQASQKIYLNGTAGDPLGEGNPGKTVLGNDWITDDGSDLVLAQNGATVLRASSVTNGVNNWHMSGNSTGGFLYLSAEGSDGSIPIALQDKGGGGIAFVSNGDVVLDASAASGSTSYLQIGPGGAGQPYTLQVLSTAGAADMVLKGSGTGAVHVSGVFRLDMFTPASSAAACTTGQTSFDANYHYDCVATNTWKRAALSTW